MKPEHILKAIASLTPDVCVKYSVYTDKFYVDARIEISDGCVLTGIVEHRDNIYDAVEAYWERLTSVPERLVVDAYKPSRAEYRWNGSIFGKVG